MKNLFFAISHLNAKNYNFIIYLFHQTVCVQSSRKEFSLSFCFCLFFSFYYFSSRNFFMQLSLAVFFLSFFISFFFLSHFTSFIFFFFVFTQSPSTDAWSKFANFKFVVIRKQQKKILKVLFFFCKHTKWRKNNKKSFPSMSTWKFPATILQENFLRDEENAKKNEGKAGKVFSLSFAVERKINCFFLLFYPLLLCSRNYYWLNVLTVFRITHDGQLT